MMIMAIEICFSVICNHQNGMKLKEIALKVNFPCWTAADLIMKWKDIGSITLKINSGRTQKLTKSMVHIPLQSLKTCNLISKELANMIQHILILDTADIWCILIKVTMGLSSSKLVHWSQEKSRMDWWVKNWAALWKWLKTLFQTKFWKSSDDGSTKSKTSLCWVFPVVRLEYWWWIQCDVYLTTRLLSINKYYYHMAIGYRSCIFYMCAVWRYLHSMHMCVCLCVCVCVCK